MKKKKYLALRTESPINLFDKLFGNFWSLDEWTIAPIKERAKITEDDTNVYVSADIPGFEKKEIKIDIDRYYLSICAKKENENERQSICLGYTIPSLVDIKTSKAIYENGVLKLTLPKNKEIEVKNTIAIE